MFPPVASSELKLVYSIIYSYWYFYDKVFLPQAIHVYTHKLVCENIVSDLWRDWFWTGMGPYSSKLGYQILYLKNNGLLREVCLDKICGLLTISNSEVKPARLFLTIV